MSKVRTTDESGGPPAEIELVATDDTSEWTMTGSNGKPVSVRVVPVAGDSIVTEAGPYELSSAGLRVHGRRSGSRD
jgi:hypothetical protein